jgi:hypothetical protein
MNKPADELEEDEEEEIFVSDNYCHNNQHIIADESEEELFLPDELFDNRLPYMACFSMVDSSDL